MNWEADDQTWQQSLHTNMYSLNGIRTVNAADRYQIKGIVRYKMWCVTFCKKTKNGLRCMNVILLYCNHQHIGHSCGHPEGLIGRMKPENFRCWQRQRIPLNLWHISNKRHVISQKTWPWRKLQFCKQQSEALLCNTCQYLPKSKPTTEEAETPNWVVMGYNRTQLRVAVFSQGGTDSERRFWIMNSSQPASQPTSHLLRDSLRR